MQNSFQFNIVRAVQSKLRNSKIILGLTLIAPLYRYIECTIKSNSITYIALFN